MSTVITTGALAKLMRPGLFDIFGNAYEQWPQEWKGLYDENVSRLGYEELQMVSTMGLARVKSEGSPISYDDVKQSWYVRGQHDVYSLGYIITREAADDNLYWSTADIKTAGLAYSMSQTKNIVAANIFNYAFDPAHSGGDGVPLISTQHPTEYGLQSNALTIASDLSEMALESILKQIRDTRDNRGKKMMLQEEYLVVPTALEYEATRILRNPQRPGTADRDINAMNYIGNFPKGIKVWRFLSGSTAWFVTTNCPRGLMYFERDPIEFSEENDWETDNMKFKARERYVFTAVDWRGIAGSQHG